MRTVQQVSDLTSVSVRTQQYYDKIGLLTLKRAHMDNLVTFA